MCRSSWVFTRISPKKPAEKCFSMQVAEPKSAEKCIHSWVKPAKKCVFAEVSKPKACHYLAGDRENENSCWQQGNVPFFFFLVTPMGEILRKSYKRRGPTPSPFYILFLTDKVPLFYTFYWEMVPLLTYVVYNFDVISLPFCICLL